MYLWLAAMFLLPASCCVFTTPRAWGAAMRMGPKAFFSVVVKTAPLHVRRSPSRWRNMLVYWPMKIGIDLVRSRSTQVTLYKVWRKVRHGIPMDFSAGMTPSPVNTLLPPHISTDEIRGMIRDADIKLVSFDIFDTLLERPVLQPKDMLYLVAAKVDPLYKVDFIKMRWTAEEELGKPNATIHDIYAHMQQKYGLTSDLSTALMDEEIACEAALLAPRADIKLCYDEAVNLGKRIIAVSDMYLPADVLQPILHDAGYTQISTVYVSCDYGKRKSDGSLYDVVLTAEQVHPSEMLHIGDNYRSDYCAALTCYVTAVYCPSPYVQCLADDADFAAVVDENVRKDHFWSPLLAFSLQQFCAANTMRTPLVDVPDAASFAKLTIAPLLTGYCLGLAGNTELQQGYPQIHFASRDGYLPHKVYTAIQRYVPCMEAVYFYAGRRAYYPFLYDSFFAYVASLEPTGDTHYSLHDFVLAHFKGAEIYQTFETGLTDHEKALSFMGEQKRCLHVLKRFETEIEAFMREKRARAKHYYDTVFPEESTSALIFDIGYSGSIGQALAAAIGRRVDKLYFWEKHANKERDVAAGSCTRVFMNDRGFIPYNLLFEEVFSPCEGGVVDFDTNAKPVFEDFPVRSAFQTDMDAMHEECRDFATAFCTRLGPYAQYVRPKFGDTPVALCQFLLAQSPYCNQRLFKNIVFPDPIYYAEKPSLERKLERSLAYKTVFAGTGFDDPRHVLVPEYAWDPAPKLGMHIHLHNVTLADEVVRYLHTFTAPLDIYVTITDKDAERTVQKLFCKARIPNVQNSKVLPVPNRGRDIAPWLLAMRPYQAEYDLFCHIHAKESLHFDFGAAWRYYLFNNLLLPAAVGDILALFRQQPDLGCVFPPAFPPLAAFMATSDIPPTGLKGERQMAEALLRRMNLEGEICRSEVFFSVGTMLWYRPQALHQLFTFDLCWEDFPEEPIGVEGTNAHAIERLPALIATRNGYRAGTFVKHV